ncbi:MAG: GNAT family N-acetyltransferase [Ferruginibacter sp.]
MEIKHRKDGSKGAFYIEENSRLLGEMTYSMAGPGLMIIDHTEVDDALKGQNAGLQLLNKAADFARTNQLKIIPLCPFANAMFKRKPEVFGDLLHKSE